MNGLLSKILDSFSGSQDPVEEQGRREDAFLLLRENTRVVDANYDDYDASNFVGSFWTKAKSWFTWDASPKYGQVAASDFEDAASGQKEDNSCAVLPSTELEDVVKISAACSSDVKDAMAARTSSSHGSGQRCYGGGGGFPSR